MSLFSKLFIGDNERKRKLEEMRKRTFARITFLRESSSFFFVVDEAYMETFQGKQVPKLIGCCEIGSASRYDEFTICDCGGNIKGRFRAVDIYAGANPVENVKADDELLAIYPDNEDISYVAGDFVFITR